MTFFLQKKDFIFLEKRIPYAYKMVTNINEIDGVYCKRSFAPDIDFEKLLKENKCSFLLYTML